MPFITTMPVIYDEFHFLDVSPNFLEVFKSRKLQPGPSVSLRCTATGRPTPNISWTFNGRLIKKSQKYIIRQETEDRRTIGSSLIIKNTKTQDGGTYTCNATNRLESVLHTETIHIYGLPIVHQPDNVTIAVGENLIVTCYASGYPIKYIQWERGTFSIYLSFLAIFTDFFYLLNILPFYFVSYYPTCISYFNVMTRFRHYTH